MPFLLFANSSLCVFFSVPLCLCGSTAEIAMPRYAFVLALAGLVPSQSFNPYTGQGVPYPAHNSYNGTSANSPAGFNPYTGSNPVTASTYNPLTGSNGTNDAAYNPLTGRYGERAQNRTAPGSWDRTIPITGKEGPGLEDIDAGVLRVLERYAIPGAAMAIAKDGKLVLARGYGWANLQTGEPVRPDALFGLASLSKSITAVTILKLVDQGKLRLDDPAFQYLADLQPPPGLGVDPRISKITIRQLLNHSGGWDRSISGEPSTFSWRVARTFQVPVPITADQLICHMLPQPLDFEPGTKAEYSNFGYIVLGQIIEHVTRQPYAEYVKKNTLEPMGVFRAALPGLGPEYLPGEVRRYQQGTDQLMPPRYLPPLADAAGSWTASAVDLARFLTALDGSRGAKFLSDATFEQMLAPPPPPIKPWPNGTYFGLGWDMVRRTPEGVGYAKDGLLPGSRTFMGRRPNGVVWVVLFNSGDALSGKDVVAAFDPKREMEQHVHRAREWPKVDLFNEFP
jgi:N-acyl-D-amino-acid deacylase